ncbi:MAG: origin recognition complex subunit 4 C-terminus-domain-containing protein, partial [Olpidium bornovanus]
LLTLRHPRRKTSFAQALTHLLSVFRSSGREAVPVVFVLDEFDLFAEQPRQSLLYTLFDICQGEKSPIAVVGVTCRIDALELLEKRVKSRFSHRQIRLSPPASFEDYKTVAVNAMTLRPQNEDDVEYFTEFNKRVSEAFEHHRLQGVARRLYNRDKSVRALFKTLIDPVCALTPDKPFLDVEGVCASDARQRADSKTELLLGVSILELQLIIAMKRHYELEVMTFNFEMIYDEYKDFMDRAQASGSVGLKRATKPVAMKVCGKF